MRDGRAQFETEGPGQKSGGTETMGTVDMEDQRETGDFLHVAIAL